MKRLPVPGLIILCLLLLLGGCSSVQLMYSQLDWLIPWYLKDYVSLTDEQNAFLEKRLRTQLRWHRNTQLPIYARWLRQIRLDAQNGLTREELNYHSERFEEHWNKLLRQITPDVSVLFTMVSNEQVAELFTNIEQRNQEYTKDYIELSDGELRRKRAERVREHLERWLDELTAKQIKAVTEWSQRFELNSAETLSYRRQWQARLRRLLATRHDADRFEIALRDHLLNPNRSQSMFLQQRRARNREVFLELLLRIDTLMTVQQRTYLTTKIDELANDFEALAEAID